MVTRKQADQVTNALHVFNSTYTVSTVFYFKVKKKTFVNNISTIFLVIINLHINLVQESCQSFICFLLFLISDV